MKDISDFLLHDEQCLYQTQPHWILYGMPVLFAFFTLLTLFIPFSAWEVTGVFLLFTVATGIFSWMNRYFTIYAITNKRILKKSGVISRYTSGILLSKVESVDVLQPILGRIFGYGTIIIRGTGGGVDTFFRVEYPFKFRRQLADVLSHQ